MSRGLVVKNVKLSVHQQIQWKSILTRLLCHLSNHLGYFLAIFQVVGMHQPWKGGDVLYHPGGGHKINLLKESLAEYKDDENLVIMFTDR